MRIDSAMPVRAPTQLPANCSKLVGGGIAGDDMATADCRHLREPKLRHTGVSIGHTEVVEQAHDEVKL